MYYDLGLLDVHVVLASPGITKTPVAAKLLRVVEDERPSYHQDLVLDACFVNRFLGRFAPWRLKAAMNRRTFRLTSWTCSVASAPTPLPSIGSSRARLASAVTSVASASRNGRSPERLCGCQWLDRT